MERMFLQTGPLADCWREPKVSSRVKGASSLLEWLEVDQCRTPQALRAQCHHVWVMFVSQTLEVLWKKSFDTILGTKNYHMSVSRILDDHCSLLVTETGNLSLPWRTQDRLKVNSHPAPVKAWNFSRMPKVPSTGTETSPPKFQWGWRL